MTVQKILRFEKKIGQSYCAQAFSGLLIPILLVLAFILPSLAWSVPGLEDEDIAQLYRSGQYSKLSSALNDSDVLESMGSLYLGLSYLHLGDSTKAIRAWKSYVRLEQGSEGGRKISKYLTILMKQEAKRQAEEQLQQERTLSRSLNPKAIAVYPFANKGSSSYASLSKGLASMIISDLSQVKALTVVERIQIQALLNELKLSQSGIVDSKSAPRIGKLVGAAKFTTGSFMDLDQKKMRLDASITKTESGEKLSDIGVGGELKSFYKLEKVLVVKLLCSLGYCPESLDSRTRLAVEKIHTKNLKAFQLYSEGLDFFDRGDYRKAAQSFVHALEEDPEFELVRRALIDTPILSLDIGTMISGAESISQGHDPFVSFEPSPGTLPVLQAAVVPVTPQIFQQPPVDPVVPSSTAPVEIQIDFP